MMRMEKITTEMVRMNRKWPQILNHHFEVIRFDLKSQKNKMKLEAAIFSVSIKLGNVFIWMQKKIIHWYLMF